MTVKSFIRYKVFLLHTFCKHIFELVDQGAVFELDSEGPGCGRVGAEVIGAPLQVVGEQGLHGDQVVDEEGVLVS